MTEQAPTDALAPCCFCGMPCGPNDYHPYAACLMFKACNNSETVRANLEAVRGSPVVAGEPIGYLYCGGSYGDELADWEIVADQHQCDKLNEHHGALGKESKQPLYTTPQPTQAQAGAVLTAELIQQLVEALDDLVEAGEEAWSECRPCVRIGKETATAARARLKEIAP